MADAHWTDADIERAFKAGAKAMEDEPLREVEHLWWHSETRRDVERARRRRGRSE